MLRRAKKVVKRLAAESSVAIHHSDSDSEHVRMANSNSTLESTVFGGESNVTEQLENFEVVTSGYKVSFQ